MGGHDRAPAPPNQSRNRNDQFGQALQDEVRRTGRRAALEWLEIHSREAFWAGVAVLVIAGGVWFYQKSQAAQTRNAYTALDEAEQALNSGNLPLAQSDLERMVKRYGATEAGKVGTILLAQVHYQKGEYQAGIDALKPLTTAERPLFQRERALAGRRRATSSSGSSRRRRSSTSWPRRRRSTTRTRQATWRRRRGR